MKLTVTVHINSTPICRHKLYLEPTLQIKKDDANSAKKKDDRTTEAAEGIDQPTTTRAKFRFDNEQG